MTEIITAMITGGLALLGVVLSNTAAARRTDEQIREQIRTSQAVTDTKLEELTREVREHNGFAKRVPVLEEQMRMTDRRIQDLEDRIN